ncbi:MAG: NAD-dependent succinate-semialdehyde dehydrogenase [Roseivirga sp.]|nr:NAD-dependent succinate-semialdehyde dehydrogenase [Roseivirga sp.]
MLSLIKNRQLVNSQLFINGHWISAADGQTFDVYNPFDHELLGKVADGGVEETEEAIVAAHTALASWQALAAIDRSRILKRWHNLVLENQEDLAILLTLEQGKPLTESRGEIAYGASYIEWFAEEAKRVYGDTIPGPQADKRTIVLKQPIGVVAAITPWNFPNAMITRKVAPALAAGCTVVLKPSEETPFSALAIAYLASEAGVPPGVFNVITTTQAAEAGEVLTSSPVVKKLSFTGSTAIGKLLMKQCADTVKKLSLELGGNAPFIVFNDADVDAAVEGAIVSKYRNAGQTCVCANRIYVQEAVYDVFVEKLKVATDKLRLGSGLNEGVNIGPLINEKAATKVEGLVKDALECGASLELGGHRFYSGSLLYLPTIITDARFEMKISSEEIFGPVAAVYKFETVDEVIRLANNTDAGLAAYFYGKDNALIWKVAEALEYGMVGINTGIISDAAAPFGGVKQSGFGREGSKYGLDDYLVTKYLSIKT